MDMATALTAIFEEVPESIGGGYVAYTDAIEQLLEATRTLVRKTGSRQENYT